MLDDVGGYELSADGKKLLVARGGNWYVTAAAEGAKADKALPTGSLETHRRSRGGMAADVQRRVAHRARLFLRPASAPRPVAGDARTLRQAARRLRDAPRRELRPRRTARRTERLARLPQRRRSRGGAAPATSATSAATSRSSRARIASSASSTSRRGIPASARRCAQPGVKVKEGDWLLAVNGRKLDTATEPVGRIPGPRGQARHPHRQRQARRWKARAKSSCRRSAARARCATTRGSNRTAAASTQASGGRVGYIYVQNTGHDGQNELYRQFRAQSFKDAPHHRRTLERRRPDSRPLHRTAQSPRDELLGRPRRQATGRRPSSRTAARR